MKECPRKPRDRRHKVSGLWIYRLEADEESWPEDHVEDLRDEMSSELTDPLKELSPFLTSDMEVIFKYQIILNPRTKEGTNGKGNVSHIDPRR